MKMLKQAYCVAVLLILFIDISRAFFAHVGKDGNWRTKTHSDITNIGVSRAMNEHIKNKGFYSMDDFFANDENGKTAMLQNIRKLGNVIADTQTNKRETAYVHCHGDQIDLAHNYVKSCKIKLKQWVNDKEELLQQLGECLYTVQSFYSNTNWVEMFGPVSYDDFGVNTLMDIASPDEDTCEDNANYNSQCKDNIIVKDKLTSGYHHSRGNQKPAKATGSTKGKCSHGGKDDSSRTLVARCGINKDSVVDEYAPHSHLHKDAWSAAVTATENFLIANGTGIIDIIGSKVFDSLFHVKRRTDKSLVLVIDYTASMTDDIAAVKETVIHLLTATVGSDNEPADYVLSLFHDPETMNERFHYENGYDMIDKVKTINTVVGNNPDCDEPAAAGILSAIDLSRQNSPLLVFTDANAKDENRMNEVIEAATAKNISITAMVSNQCPTRRNINGGRSTRSLSFFEQIAAATGGTVYHTDKDNIGNVIEEVLQDIFPSSEVMIQCSNFPSSNADFGITVDSAVNVLKIIVIGAVAVTDVTLTYPDGTSEDFTSGTSTTLLSSGQLILSIQNPPPGELRLQRNVNDEWQVNVTGQSQVKVQVEILEQTAEGDLFSLKGSPIAGRNYTVSFSVYGLSDNATCQNIDVVGVNGAVLSSYNTSMLRRDFDTLCAASISVSDEEFQLRLTGIDDVGYPMYRQLSTTYNPTNIELKIEASTDDLVVGRGRLIRFVLVNTGVITENCQVSISVSNGNIEGLSTYPIDIDGMSANGSFVIKATTPGIILQYTVRAVLTSSSEVQQSLTRKLYPYRSFKTNPLWLSCPTLMEGNWQVTDIERPECSVLNTIGICKPESLNTANCSLYKWSSEAVVSFSGVELQSISSTVGKAVTITHMNISRLISGPLAVNVSGNCCSPELQISVVDTHGFISQCDLSFSDGTLVQSVEVVSTPIDRESKDFIIIVAAMCTSVIIVPIIIFVLLHVLGKKEPTDKLEKINLKPDVVKPKRFNKYVLSQKM